MLIINKEKNDIWKIPENNYIDIIYLIKEEKVSEIIINNLESNINNNANNITKTNYNKNLVLFKKLNINNKNKNNCENEINKKIDKKNTSYSFKIKNFFNITFNKSNDASLGLGVKNLINKSNNIFKSHKKISCDVNDIYSTNLNKTKIDKKRNQTIYYKRDNFKDFSLDKENDEQSYAFQNLVNLNKNGKKDIFFKKINDINKKNYNIQIKKK